MKSSTLTSVLRRTLAAIVLVAGASASAHALPAWDLTGDWSDTANPNGAWTLRDGGSALPFHVDAWQGLSGDFASAQPAWTTSSTMVSSLPTFFRSSAVISIVHDWQAGDVVCHSQDDFNGLGFGPANALWSSPIQGIVDVSGGVWMGRDIGRANHWSLWVRGAKVTEGDIASGDAYSRAAPFDLRAGSGGAAAVTGIAVSVGDAIELRIERASSPSNAGDYAGIVFHLAATTVLGVGPNGGAQSPLVLLPVRPNPARGRVLPVEFSLSGNAAARLELLDVGGRRVAARDVGGLGAGAHRVSLSVGRRVVPGIYFLRLAQGGQVRTSRVAMLE